MHTILRRVLVFAPNAFVAAVAIAGVVAWRAGKRWARSRRTVNA